jgi:hypothetical protein
VGLQWEVKPLGTLFDGTGLGGGNPGTDTGVPAGAEGSAVTLSQRVAFLEPGIPYHWRLRIVADSPFFPHSVWFSLPYNNPSETDFRTAGGSSDVAFGETDRLTSLSLKPALPNPFRSQTVVAFTLPRGGPIRLTVYDAAGRGVKTLMNSVQAAGSHSVAWNGQNDRGALVTPGVYFARLAFGGEVRYCKLELAR